VARLKKTAGQDVSSGYYTHGRPSLHRRGVRAKRASEALGVVIADAVSAFNTKHYDVQINVTCIESESFKTQLQYE
jgi:hypothetical protein